MSYFLAPALVRLRHEANQAFPNRSTASDGWIGDASHAARRSEHNPCWTCSGRRYGIVQALDVDHSRDGRPNVDLREMLLEVTIGDPRVWYVISRGVIYSRTYGWAGRAYAGHPHNDHVHVSIRGYDGVDAATAERLAFDSSPWGLQRATKDARDAARPPKEKALPPVSLHGVRHAARVPRREVHPIAVKRVQRALNARFDAGLAVDGIYGPRTRAAYRAFEERLPNVDANGIPVERSLTRLGANRFRVTN